MKKIKYLLVFSLGFIISASYGMKRVYPQYNNAPKEMYDAKVQTYFVPDDRKVMKDDLFALLDGATKSIYVAMYWITDNSLLDRLIAAKKRNVEVEIYIDASSPNITESLEKLLKNDIVPIVFPSRKNGSGILHDKFFMIDFETVFTGSANFTRSAFDHNADVFNFENMVRIDSFEVASQYLKAFVSRQVGMFDIYVDMIVQSGLEQAPVWLNKLLPILFKKEGRLVRAFNIRMNQYTPDDIQWKRLSEFINKTTQG